MHIPTRSRCADDVYQDFTSAYSCPRPRFNLVLNFHIPILTLDLNALLPLLPLSQHTILPLINCHLFFRCPTEIIPIPIPSSGPCSVRFNLSPQLV